MLLVWDLVAMVTGLSLAFYLGLSSHESGFFSMFWFGSWVFLTDQTALDSSYRTSIN